MGRPSSYTPALAQEVCERLSAGESLRKICRDDHMPSESTVLSWAQTDQFSEQYASARARGYMLLAEDLLEIADTPLTGQKTVSKATGLEITEADMIEHRRLQIDTRKWMLSKMLPKVYGDRQHIEHSGKLGLEALIAGDDDKAG